MTLKVLIANRGEIAVRIARAARELGWRVVTVYTPEDAYSLHRLVADESYEVSSYLAKEEIVEVATRAGVDVVHPGYGFLAEDPSFARMVLNAGMEWAGPRPEKMDLLSDKMAVKELAMKVGIPTLPFREVASVKDVEDFAKRYGYPLILKRSREGGGRGQRVVWSYSDAEKALEVLAKEGRGRIYVEKYIPRAKHVEVQIAGDRHGAVVHLFERECSIQRRRQKIVEEAPSPTMVRNTELREELLGYAVKLAEAVNYDSVGTIEFVYDIDSGRIYLIECNARLQVEHGVTEMVTGIDLVKLQLLTAIGRELPVKQRDIAVRGWAIEARIYAEDPENGFAPSEGVVERFYIPTGPGIRIDTAVHEGSYIDPRYDTLIAKVIAWGEDRYTAIERLRRALDETIIGGVKTNLELLRVVVRDERFVDGSYTTTYLEESLPRFVETIRRIRRVVAVALEAIRSEVRRVRSSISSLVRGGRISAPCYGWLAADSGRLW